MKIKNALILLSITLFVFSSCKKEGPAGPAGKDGNANVISSNTLTLTNWSTTFDNGTEFLYSSTINWPSITQAIKDEGVVMIYIRTSASTNWTALPYSESGNGYSDAFNFEIGVGQVFIDFDGYDSSGSPGASALNGVFTIRMVAIPSSERKANPNVNLLDYNAVKAAYHLED